MDHEFQQHRLARIEGYNITRARLHTICKRNRHPGEFEKAIAEHLAAPSAKIAAWRRSEMEQAGCREGIRLAALEFYWEHRQAAHPKDLNPELHKRSPILDFELIVHVETGRTSYWAAGAQAHPSVVVSPGTSSFRKPTFVLRRGTMYEPVKELDRAFRRRPCGFSNRFTLRYSVLQFRAHVLLDQTTDRL